jgi:hypothetical protein
MADKMQSLPFTAPMVRAILAGKKTQTRRLVSPQPETSHTWAGLPGYQFRIEMLHGVSGRYGLSTWARFKHTIPQNWEISGDYRCPHGNVGSRLWVRESWRVDMWDGENCEIRVQYRADDAVSKWMSFGEWDEDGKIFDRLWMQSSEDAMKAGVPMDAAGRHHWQMGKGPTRWRPPMFMFRWASRITLEITDLRMQRLQDISEADALAEGVEFVEGSIKERDTGNFYDLDELPPVRRFRHLWNTINAKRNAGWSVNPWVWAISFRVVSNG